MCLGVFTYDSFNLPTLIYVNSCPEFYLISNDFSIDSTHSFLKICFFYKLENYPRHLFLGEVVTFGFCAARCFKNHIFL